MKKTKTITQILRHVFCLVIIFFVSQSCSVFCMGNPQVEIDKLVKKLRGTNISPVKEAIFSLHGLGKKAIPFLIN